MRNVSDALKEAMRADSKQVFAYLDDGEDAINGSNDLVSMNIKGNSDLCKAVMRMAVVTYVGDHNYLNQYAELGIGVPIPTVVTVGVFTVTIATPALFTLISHGLDTGEKIKFTTTGALPSGIAVDTYYWLIKIDANTFYIAASYTDSLNGVPVNTSGSQSGVHTLYHYPLGVFGDPEYIVYGNFKAIEVTDNRGTEGITIKMFDRMIESLIAYDLTPSFPITNGDFLQAICDRLGWTLATPSFSNDTISIDEEIFTNQQLFRDILDQVAESAGSIIRFNGDDQLEVFQISNTPSETVDAAALRTLKVEPNYGPITSIVLSRQPQNDDIVKDSP